MSKIRRTIFYDRHKALGASIVEFGGWEMPIQYHSGIIEEHLATRKGAGLFDVSHMGRFVLTGWGSTEFLQHVLTNNVEALDIDNVGAQYTIIPNESGGAIDDAYLYHFSEEEYMLVVNAANRIKDWNHFQTILKRFDHVSLEDRTEETAMIALQGPDSRNILERVLESGSLPEPKRNSISRIRIAGNALRVSCTGYTGEPVCFELFTGRKAGPDVWDLLIEQGATPVGLGARDTLRMEAGLPLYGHELGKDPEGGEIPIMACSLSRFAVSFSPLKGNFIGKKNLFAQSNALKKILDRDYSEKSALPRLIRTVAITGRGIAREGAKILKSGKHIGYVTSGTRIPFWSFEGNVLDSRLTSEHDLRSICLAYMDCDVPEGEEVIIDIRGKHVEAVVVPYHIRSDVPPFVRPIIWRQN
jgi:aminomethyltransferase